ncbi:hypothetical protein E2C01_015975 [Portunus trituberculatus]|uniref:Secreted protein n=1 Tax=Portunus trituberculatus TaxID=210409 RepID=A0A5B7DPU1_PORTR|nr:hypothetical protein [Portunus trituberculatus]
MWSRWDWVPWLVLAEICLGLVGGVSGNTAGHIRTVVLSVRLLAPPAASSVDTVRGSLFRRPPAPPAHSLQVSNELFIVVSRGARFVTRRSMFGLRMTHDEHMLAAAEATSTPPKPCVQVVLAMVVVAAVTTVKIPAHDR